MMRRGTWAAFLLPLLVPGTCGDELQRGTYFSFFPEGVNWNAARAKCQSHGGDLASIHSSAENSLASTTLGQGRRAWIGNSDALVEGSWVWSDGTASGYTNWLDGGPDDRESGNTFGDGRDCAAMSTFFNHAGRWWDR